MAGDQNYGGPAFPHPVAIGPGGYVYSPHDVCAPGMDLRDFFAAQAFIVTYKEFDAVLGDDRLELAAEAAYRSADALLKARAAISHGGTDAGK